MTQEDKQKEIDCRKNTEAFLRELVRDMSAANSEAAMRGIARAFKTVSAELAEKHLPRDRDSNALSPMSDSEAMSYGREVMGYGQFSDTARVDVPAWYIDMAVESAEKLLKLVRSEWWQKQRD